jgi:hypothetical protein
MAVNEFIVFIFALDFGFLRLVKQTSSCPLFLDSEAGEGVQIVRSTGLRLGMGHAATCAAPFFGGLSPRITFTFPADWR